ncbi:MAG: carboxypeptidase-like regulatory domain-containing protein [Ferruginibacter sp.]
MYSGKRLLPFSLFIIFQLTATLLFAQAKLVQGIVKDSLGKPLEKVSVTVNDSRKGVTTDASGHYAIMAAPGATLNFSFTGYTTKIAIVGASNAIDIWLAAATQTIDAVVVVGYATQRKVNLSGAVAQVSGKDLINRPVPNVTEALQGVLPGVTVLRGNGNQAPKVMMYV